MSNTNFAALQKRFIAKEDKLVFEAVSKLAAATGRTPGYTALRFVHEKVRVKVVGRSGGQMEIVPYLTHLIYKGAHKRAAEYPWTTYAVGDAGLLIGDYWLRGRYDGFVTRPIKKTVSIGDTEIALPWRTP